MILDKNEGLLFNDKSGIIDTIPGDKSISHRAIIRWPMEQLT